MWAVVSYPPSGASRRREDQMEVMPFMMICIAHIDTHGRCMEKHSGDGIGGRDQQGSRAVLPFCIDIDFRLAREGGLH